MIGGWALSQQVKLAACECVVFVWQNQGDQSCNDNPKEEEETTQNYDPIKWGSVLPAGLIRSNFGEGPALCFLLLERERERDYCLFDFGL